MGDWIFPDCLSSQEIEAVRPVLDKLESSVPLPPEPYTSWGQALLDELQGRTDEGPVALPTAYLYQLADQCLRGNFKPLLAYRVLAKRLNTFLAAPRAAD